MPPVYRKKHEIFTRSCIWWKRICVKHPFLISSSDMVVGSLICCFRLLFLSVPIRCVLHPSYMRRIIVVGSLLAILIGRCRQRGRRISLPATGSDSCHCIRLAVVQCAFLGDGLMDSCQANLSERKKKLNI
jgi:hypothetical protein